MFGGADGKAKPCSGLRRANLGRITRCAGELRSFDGAGGLSVSVLLVRSEEFNLLML